MPADPLRVLLADDEPLARQFVRGHLAAMTDVALVGECADGDALPKEIARHRPDVLLLDVRMPGADVFDTLGRLLQGGGPVPAVIFTTAYDAYAVRAFELNAADYLVKPFTRERLGSALARIRLRRDQPTPAPALAAVVQDMGARPTRLLVPDRGRMVPLDVDAIVWIQAEDDYARLHTRERSFLVSRSLAELERRLDDREFLRIHRSAIVRISAIREVEAQGSSRYRVRLSDGTTLVVSRTRAAKLRDWML